MILIARSLMSPVRPTPIALKTIVVADADEVYGPDPAARRRPRRLFEILGYAKGPRAVITGAEGEDRQLATAGPVQPLRRLADRTVATRDHNPLHALGNGLGRKLGGVPRRLGEDDGRGETTDPPSRSADLRPLTAEPPAVCRRIDDDSHEQSVPRLGGPLDSNAHCTPLPISAEISPASSCENSSIAKMQPKQKNATDGGNQPR